MLEQRVDRDLVAVDDVEDAVGQTGLLQQLGGPERCRRILLRGLEHERVAARDRRRPHPHRHHRREVERRDAGDDAERLADRVDVDAGRGLLGVLALQERRHAAANSITSSPRVTSPSASESTLPCSAVRMLRDFLAVLVDELADREEELGPLRERDRAPGLEGLLRGLNRGVDLLDRREVELARLPAGRRVVDGARAPRGSGDAAAADPVADLLDGWRCFDRLCHRPSVAR